MGNIVFVACTNVGRAMIESIIYDDSFSDIKIAGVVNLKPECAIHKANYDNYFDLRESYKLNVFYCENINDKDCIEFIRHCEPDVIIQSGWSQKFSNEVLSIPQYACIGEHPAPLPKGRGAACVNWAIINGETEWGDTFFKMEDTYDTGEIYAQEMFLIERKDDVKTVYDKVAAAAVKSVKKNIRDWVNGNIVGSKQDNSLSTHYPKRRPTDGEFSLKKGSAESIYNFIRGQARPYPGAFFYLKNKNGIRKKIYVWRAALRDELLEGEIAILWNNGDKLILQRVQEEGEPEMWAEDFFKEIGGNGPCYDVCFFKNES